MAISIPWAGFMNAVFIGVTITKKSSIYYILMIGKESTRYRLFDDVLQPLGIVGRRQHRRLSIAVFKYTERSFRVMMDFDMAQDL